MRPLSLPLVQSVLVLMLTTACRPTLPADASQPADPPASPTPSPAVTASPTPKATHTPTPTATPTATPWYDRTLVAASYVALTGTDRLTLPVELVYYQAARDANLHCEGDCTAQVIFSIPTDQPRGLIYTSAYPQIDLVPLDPAIKVMPNMSPDYVPMLSRCAAEALLDFVTYVKETTGEDIYVAHTYRIFWPYDPLAAGTSQHQTGLAVDLYHGPQVRSINEIPGVLEAANQFGWVRSFDFEDPHFLYLDAVGRGYTMALVRRGVQMNGNQYAVTNALIAAYQTLTNTIPPQIRAQLDAEAPLTPTAALP